MQHSTELKTLKNQNKKILTKYNNTLIVLNRAFKAQISEK